MQTGDTDSIISTSKKFKSIIFNVDVIFGDAIFELCESLGNHSLLRSAIVSFIVKHRDWVTVPGICNTIWWTWLQADTVFICNLIFFSSQMSVSQLKNMLKLSKIKIIRINLWRYRCYHYFKSYIKWSTQKLKSRFRCLVFRKLVTNSCNWPSYMVYIKL